MTSKEIFNNTILWAQDFAPHLYHKYYRESDPAEKKMIARYILLKKIHHQPGWIYALPADLLEKVFKEVGLDVGMMETAATHYSKISILIQAVDGKFIRSFQGDRLFKYLKKRIKKEDKK